MKSLRDRIGKEWIFFDGGSGTLLQKMGLKGGELPERWNLTHPERIIELYSGYLNAGCHIFNTNTFGANRFHYPEDLDEVVSAAVRLADQARKQTGRKDALIALDIGPTGKLLEPIGDLSFEEAVDVFASVVRTGVSAGAELVLIETMSDIYEAKAAVIATKENCDLPVFCTVTFDQNAKMLTGASAEGAAAILEGLGVDALGVNCSLGPKEMFPIVERIVNASDVPVIVNPNAGLPKTKNGMTYYDITPDDFAGYMEKIAGLGVTMLGGCCGTTPKHISRLIETVSCKPVPERKQPGRTFAASGSGIAELGKKTKIIGERINPTGKKIFKQALREKNYDYIIGEGLKQEDGGADLLDVNVGLPEIDEAEMLETVVRKLQSVTTLPLQIDTSDPVALERALRIYNGKAMINSVNGKQESMDAVMPLAAKYGGVLVALCLDENGIPDTAEGRFAVAEKILKEAEKYHIRRKDIVFDGLAMTVSSDSKSALVTLETIRRIREELGCCTVLGVSNISFGLPQRQMINSFFLAMAMQNGLSCAIINPNNDTMMAGYLSACALLNQDPQCGEYISAFAAAGESAGLSLKRNDASAVQNQGTDLFSCIERGLISQAEKAVSEQLKVKKPLDIIDEFLIPALDKVGQGFEKGTVFLPQLLMSADAAKAAFAVMKNAMEPGSQSIKGDVILATVKGDIHDIGKNIVKVMLENYGYNVIDLGKDVDPELIADTAVEKNIKLVGLSALMTTTVVSMEETIRLLRKRKPDTKIVVGGAVLTQEYADMIGADAYAKDAMATVRYADSVFSDHEN